MQLDIHSIQVPVKPPSAICPWCDEEVHVAAVGGRPQLIRKCQHAERLDTNTKPIQVVFSRIGKEE